MFQSKKEKNGSNWRRNKLLVEKFSDPDSDVEKEKWDKKQEKLEKIKEEEKNM